MKRCCSHIKVEKHVIVLATDSALMRMGPEMRMATALSPKNCAACDGIWPSQVLHVNCPVMQGVTCVINYDSASSAKDYVHRTTAAFIALMLAVVFAEGFTSQHVAPG